MRTERKWPRHKAMSVRRIIARFRLGRWITREQIENRPEKIVTQLEKIAPIRFLPHVDCIVRDDRSIRHA
jgi:hypothetical protein